MSSYVAHSGPLPWTSTTKTRKMAYMSHMCPYVSHMCAYMCPDVCPHMSRTLAVGLCRGLICPICVLISPICVLICVLMCHMSRTLAVGLCRGLRRQKREGWLTCVRTERYVHHITSSYHIIISHHQITSSNHIIISHHHMVRTERY